MAYFYVRRITEPVPPDQKSKEENHKGKLKKEVESDQSTSENSDEGIEAA
eukprot:CAMPEP_0170540894 /NCGR_PEP_ID=MMETSP0211-20121228/797_1 /TAXON_ID=311385 /ORGANISM="Pseudokeronopsis sp., Strain OXSARD2" /LENGTH=49 /DNA_ID=CAMNT_0010843447 /DNA_START=87 /DNA_END=239 /DNA_ORIENTATION=-